MYFPGIRKSHFAKGHGMYFICDFVLIGAFRWTCAAFAVQRFSATAFQRSLIHWHGPFSSCLPSNASTSTCSVLTHNRTLPVPYIHMPGMSFRNRLRPISSMITTITVPGCLCSFCNEIRLANRLHSPSNNPMTKEVGMPQRHTGHRYQPLSLNFK